MIFKTNFQKQLEKEAVESERLAHQEEQERRDHELALRLANETNSGVDDLTPSLKRWVFSKLCKEVGWIEKIVLIGYVQLKLAIS